MTQRLTTSTITQRVAVLAVVGLLFAACGSNSDSEPADSTPATTPATSTTVVATAPTTNVLSVDELTELASPADESEPVPEVGVATEAPDESPGECIEENCSDPTEDPDEQEPDPLEDGVDSGIDVLEEPNDGPDNEPVFVPADGDAAFCAANDSFDEVEQPDDEAEVALIAQGFIAELIILAPDDIRADLEVFQEFVGRVVAGEADFDGAESEPAVERSGERIGEFIEGRCEGTGDGVTVAPPVDVDVALDPVLPDGLIIPVVPITGEIRETNTPFFGETGDDDRPADPQPGFVRDPLDVGFCDAVDIINNRPQPREDFEEIVVGQQYLIAIESLVPAEISMPFTVLLDWVALLVDNGSFDGINEPEDDSDLDAAIDDVDSFVNSRCLGL